MLVLSEKYFVFLLFFVLSFYIGQGEEPSVVACNVIKAKEFKNKKPKMSPWETCCVERKGECFTMCLHLPNCRSFGVVEQAKNCTSQCLLYSEATLNGDSFSRNDSASYYFLEAKTCCNSGCQNEGLCDGKTCTCECTKGFTSTSCACQTSNLSRQFMPQGQQLSADVVQVDSGKLPWAVDKHHAIFVHNNAELNGRWVKVSGGLKHVTSGGAGVWGVNNNDNIYYRAGVSSTNPSGSSWNLISGFLKQMDSGSFGVVYGINAQNDVYCRAGITEVNPTGTGFVIITGYEIKYVSCGKFGCWAIKLDNSICFRTGVTAERCQGTTWVNIDGSFIQLDSGLTGSVYAISAERVLFTRLGICAENPTGEKWEKVREGRFMHVSVGYDNLFLLTENKTLLVLK